MWEDIKQEAERNQHIHFTKVLRLLADAEALLAENTALQQRIEALERVLEQAFVTYIPGGWPDSDADEPENWERWRLVLDGQEAGDQLYGDEAWLHFKKLLDAELSALLVTQDKELDSISGPRADGEW